MKRILLACAFALLATASPAAAQLPGTGSKSDDVEFVANFAEHADTAGGRLKDGYFYITTERDLAIYDVSEPADPREVGFVVFGKPGEPVFTEEDPDTNGRILITTNGGAMQVFDVTDKTAPALLSELDGVDEHTISCVLDCTWAYGSEGAIVDLRDPANPKKAGDWAAKFGPGSSHDVTEVAPGIVLTSSEPLLLLDARTNPADPGLMASTDAPGFVHANLWPNAMTDDFALVGGEATGPGCTEDTSASFMTMDTRNWASTGKFSLVDEFKMRTGTFTDGASPETSYCVHWFSPHATYRNGGLVAIGWYEHGTRFLKVTPEGQIEEIGYFLPYGGQASAAYWISEDIVYVTDYLRGLDVLRWTGDIPQGRPATGTATPPTGGGGGGSGGGSAAARGASFDQLVRLPSAKRCVRSLRIRARRFKADPVRSLVVRVNGKRAGRARGTAKARRGVRVRRLPRKRFAVVVEVRTKSGRKTAGQRFYRGCARR